MRSQFLYNFTRAVPALFIALVGFGCLGRATAPVLPPASTPTPAPTLLETVSSTPTQAVATVPPATTTLTPEPPSQEGVLYQDDFTEIGSWDEFTFGNYYVGYHEPEYYHLEVRAPNDYVVVSLKDTSFADFTAEIEVFVDTGLSEAGGDFRYGLAFRRSGSQYYTFTISPSTRTWSVFKSSPAELKLLQEGSSSAIQGLEAPDRLRVDAKGGDFYFHINDEFVGLVSDEDYGTGEVGFFVQTIDNPKAHIHYDSLVVREVETPQPQDAVLYEDDFTELASGWPEVVFGNYYIGYHEPDYYHIEVNEPNDQALVTLPDHSFADFTAEVEVFVDTGLSEAGGDFRYGLALRRSGSQYYTFTISPSTRTWSVFKSSPAELKLLQEGSSSAIQGLEAPDRLRVDAKGGDFYFSINEEFVGLVSDEDYGTGEVGFFVQTLDNPKAHIHYDSLVVREVETPQFLCSVVTQAVNLRTGPSTTYRLLTALVNGDSFAPLGRSSNGLWIQARVEKGGRMGWIAYSDNFVECDIPVADLPVVEP